MKKLLLTLILTLTTTTAMADWTLIISTSDADVVIYADLTTIRKTDNGFRMWELMNFKTVQEQSGQRWLSNKLLREYDCEAEAGRTLSFSQHSKNMGKGDVIYNDRNVTTWNYIAPESLAAYTFKEACDKLN